MSVDRPFLARRLAAVALWTAVALTVARCALVYAIDRYARGLDAAMTAWRTAERVPWVLVWSLATGLVAAIALDTGRASSAGRIARVLLVAVALLAVLSGWPFDDAFHVPGPGSARGLATLAVLAAIALLGAAILARAVRGDDVASRAIVSAPSLAAAGALAIALPLVARGFDAGPSAAIVVREIARDLALDRSSWTVERAHPSAPPRADSLTPSLRARSDGGELPALVMPPPCRVAFTVSPDERGSRLHAAAGCDLTVARAYESRAAAPTIVFRITVDGKRVHESRRTPWAGEDEGLRVWSRLGGGEGLEVAPGSRVVLEAALEGANAHENGPEIAAGFGGVVLERRYERPRARASGTTPNVVLVVVDTLRADRTSAYGYARPTTPVLASLAARGATFEQAFATSSWTWPSTASILTGLEPGAHGVVSDAECWLADELETLPEALQREGVTTAAFACNPLVARSRNFDAGFETFEHSPERFLTAAQVMPSVLGWLDAHASTRFFLYLHLVEPHELHRSAPEDRARFAGPKPHDLDEHALHAYAERLLAGGARAADGTWDPSRVVPESHRRWLSDAYDAAVASGDRAIGEVLARLERLGLRDDTVVVVTSDHGEELLEHGHLQHGQSLHTELVHVPLVIAGPGFAAGTRISAPISNRHLAPTLARIGGSSLRVAGALDLQDLAARRTTSEPEPLFLATECGWWEGARDVGVRAIRADGWSLHQRAGIAAGARLFDLRADPGELVDVAATHPGIVSALLARIAANEKAQAELRPRAIRSGEGTRELLRASGYAGEER